MLLLVCSPQKELVDADVQILYLTQPIFSQDDEDEDKGKGKKGVYLLSELKACIFKMHVASFGYKKASTEHHGFLIKP